MIGARFDFSGSRAIAKGADFRQKFVLKDPDGVPLDLVGCEVFAQVKKETKENTKILLTLTATLADNASPKPDPATGEVLLYCTMEDINTLLTEGANHDVAQRYTWDCYIRWSNGQRDRLFFGWFDVSPRDTEIESYGNP